MKIKFWKEISQMASDKLTFRPRSRLKDSETTSSEDTKLNNKKDQLTKLLSAERDALQIESTDLSNRIESMQNQFKRVQRRLKLIEGLLEDEKLETFVREE